MTKKVFGFAVLFGFLFMVSCEDENPNENSDINHEKTEFEIPEMNFCDCIDPLPENIENCNLAYPSPINEQDSIDWNVMTAECHEEEVSMMDTLTKVEIDSAMNAYENDMSLEIKEIEEEKEDPISDECKTFLEEYAAEIKSFSSFLDQMEKNPDDINLMIARPTAEEDLYGYASNPQMFQCSQNEAFKKQVEILNNKRDKLLSN